MPDLQNLLERVDSLSSQFVLCNLVDPTDLDKFLQELSRLRSEPSMRELAQPARMIVSTVAAVGMLRKSSSAKVSEVLTLLLSSLKQVLLEIGQNGSVDELVKDFNAQLQSIVSGSAGVVKGLMESQLKEIPGFINRTLSALDEAESDLLALEKSKAPAEDVHALFRIFHTIKGDANLLGVTHIGTLAHEVEDSLGVLRDGLIRLDDQVASILLQAIDALRSVLKNFPSEATGEVGKELLPVAQTIQRLREARLQVQAGPLPLKPEQVSIPVPEKKASESIFERHVPHIPTLDLSSGPDLIMEFVNEGFDHLTNSENSILKLETNPADKEAVDSIFRAFHTIKGAAGFLEMTDIRTLAHEAETMLDMVRKGALPFQGKVVELTLSSVDLIRKLLSLLVEQVNNAGQLKSPYLDIGEQLFCLREVISGKFREPVGEILLSSGSITEEELQKALAIQNEQSPKKKVGQILIETQAASAKQVQAALETQKTPAVAENSIKIQLDKLDSLIDLVGELVISETQVVQGALFQGLSDQRIRKNLSELDSITRRLQQIAMGMRLVPVGPSFQKMVRLVRDLSKKLGKEVAITLSGEETEIDKNMVELIGDPLMHMVRNSLDHGIEPREVRLDRGKPAAGKIHLSAFHRGSNVVIEICDDGGGLNKDKILAKAVERGLVKTGEEVPEKRIFNLIFEPGFSTAEKVTDVSGRGVGMDVVRKNIEKLRGKIEIASEAGAGSVFSIYLPITLAIIEGIVVRVGSERYILPISSVVEFVQPSQDARSQVYDQNEMFKVYGKVYPLVRLNNLFGLSSCCEKFMESTVCIVDSDHGRACLVVDELLGQQQVVIKSMGESMRSIQGVSGAAILGDGRVGLILDVNGLVALAIR